MSKFIWGSAGWKGKGPLHVYVEDDGRVVAHIIRDEDIGLPPIYQHLAQPPIKIRGEDIVAAARIIFMECKAIEALAQYERGRLPRTAIERALIAFLGELSPDNPKQSGIGGWVSLLCRGPQSLFHGMVGHTVRRDNPHLVSLINDISKHGNLIREAVKKQEAQVLQEADNGAEISDPGGDVPAEDFDDSRLPEKLRRAIEHADFLRAEITKSPLFVSGKHLERFLSYATYRPWTKITDRAAVVGFVRGNPGITEVYRLAQDKWQASRAALQAPEERGARE